jgi:outer membrane protein assembly factor BamD
MGCASGGLDEKDPKSLYEHAVENIESARYQLAIDQLNKIKHEFPYSAFAVEAQWRLADTFFLQEQLIEAAVTYEIFFDLYPNHSKNAYALFQIAKCYHNSTPKNPERDLTYAQKAIKAYQKFMKQAPFDPQIADAKKNIQALNNLLAQKELVIGNFYFQKKDYLAAKMRFEKILARHGDTLVAAKAKEKLGFLIQHGLTENAD